MFRVYKKCIMWKYIWTFNRLVIILHEKAINVSDLKNKMKNENYHTVRTISKIKYQNREKEG
jgi:hypothetical protein